MCSGYIDRLVLVDRGVCVYSGYIGRLVLVDRGVCVYSGYIDRLVLVERGVCVQWIHRQAGERSPRQV